MGPPIFKVVPYELMSNLFVSPLISPIVVSHLCNPPLKEFKLYLQREMHGDSEMKV